MMNNDEITAAINDINSKLMSIDTKIELFKKRFVHHVNRIDAHQEPIDG